MFKIERLTFYSDENLLISVTSVILFDSNKVLNLQVLLWDEPFNNEDLAMSGVVGTNDEVTRIYFANTRVKCVLATRQKNNRGMLETLVSNTSFSHHQKTGF